MLSIIKNSYAKYFTNTNKKYKIDMNDKIDVYDVIIGKKYPTDIIELIDKYVDDPNPYGLKNWMDRKKKQQLDAHKHKTILLEELKGDDYHLDNDNSDSDMDDYWDEHMRQQMERENREREQRAQRRQRERERRHTLYYRMNHRVIQEDSSRNMFTLW